MSSLDRVMACPASAVLPPTREVSSGVWASRGNVIHAFLRDVNHLGREEALTRVPLEHLEACEGIDLSQMPVSPDAYAAEVALAYDWAQDTGREINRGTDSREYGAWPTEVAGRTDVVAVTDTAVRVLDYKTGYRYLGRADESWQLRGYALAAARAYGKREAEVSFIRVTEDGSPWFIHGKLGFLDLEEAALALTTTGETIERLRGERAGEDGKGRLLEGHLKAGPHCRYCPAFGRCPEQARLLRSVVADGQLFAEGKLEAPALDATTAPLVYERLKLAQKALDFAKDALERYADDAPVPVLGSDGLVWGPISTPREEFDAVRAAAVLGQRYGPDVATAAVESKPKLTKASLERALRGWMQHRRGEGHRITKLKLEALEALRKGEAAVIRSHTEYREHRPDIPTDESAAASAPLLEAVPR